MKYIITESQYKLKGWGFFIYGVFM